MINKSMTQNLESLISKFSYQILELEVASTEQEVESTSDNTKLKSSMNLQRTTRTVDNFTA